MYNCIIVRHEYIICLGGIALCEVSTLAVDSRRVSRHYVERSRSEQILAAANEDGAACSVAVALMWFMAGASGRETPRN